MNAARSAYLPDPISHHAYCLPGGRAEADALKAELMRAEAARPGDPDFIERRYETFAIDDAREIQALAETRPVSLEGWKTFLIAMDGITVEAQNALLKALEEPGDRVRFFLVIPSASLLLPTVRSRVSFLGQAMNGGKGGGGRKTGGSGDVTQGEAAALARKLIAAPVKARLDIVKSFMDDISKEKRGKHDAIDLLDAIEAALYEGGARKNARALGAVLMAKSYATDRSPSLKMLLEYVALAV